MVYGGQGTWSVESAQPGLRMLARESRQPLEGRSTLPGRGLSAQEGSKALPSPSHRRPLRNPASNSPDAGLRGQHQLLWGSVLPAVHG